MATKTTRATGSAARRHVRCYLCGNVSEVSPKALSTTCPFCHKAIKIEDVVVKNYLPVNDVQTCGTITVTKKGRIAARRIQAGDGVVCEGAMEGKLETAGPVQLGSNASWKGTELFSSSLSIEEGATLVGYVAVPCVAAPAALVESKPLVRHVDPSLVVEKDETGVSLFSGDEQAESKPALKPLPTPRVISTRKAAVERAASTKRKANDAPLPTPKPAVKPASKTATSRDSTVRAKVITTRKPASSAEPKPAATRKPAAISAATKKTEAAKAAAPPKVISTRKAAADRSAESARAQTGGTRSASKSGAIAKKTKRTHE